MSKNLKVYTVKIEKGTHLECRQINSQTWKIVTATKAFEAYTVKEAWGAPKLDDFWLNKQQLVEHLRAYDREGRGQFSADRLKTVPAEVIWVFRTSDYTILGLGEELAGLILVNN